LGLGSARERHNGKWKSQTQRVGAFLPERRFARRSNAAASSHHRILRFVQAKIMRTTLLPLCALGLLAGEVMAFAQQPATTNFEHINSTGARALAPKWLARGSPQQRAWAAYWVARDRLDQLTPNLLDALESYQASGEAGSSDWNDDDAALLEVLDTLIQLNADVDPDTAGALYVKFPVPALVLLAHSHEDARGALLGIFESTQWWGMEDWLAVADLLAVNPPAGFAARLLKEISVHATVQVLTPGRGGVGFGGAGDCVGSLGDGPRLDWPPVGAYRLAAHPEPAAELLAAGENPVYFVRTLTRDYGRGAHSLSDCGIPGWPHATLGELSRDLIGQLLGMKKEQFALDLEPNLVVTWSSPKAYLESATAFVQKQKGILYQTERGLEDQGLLTGSEAASVPVPFEVQVIDVRLDKSPLPELAFPDSFITVTYQSVDPGPAN
jgi:hypothetical protein